MRKRRQNVAIAIAVLATLLIAARAALPFVVKDYVNATLSEIEGYDGSVDDIDLNLWRGAYRIDRLRIVKRGSARPKPFFRSDSIDLSIEWRSLLRGSLVGESDFYRPDLNLVQAESESASQLGTGVNWHDRLEELFPFRFNTVRVRDGRVTFVAPGIRTQDALTAEHVDGEIVNLTNVIEQQKATFAAFNARARVLGDAPLEAQGSLDPLARQAAFDLDLQLENVQLPRVNPWLREYIKADAESGEFALYLEIATQGGKFRGYAKPILKDVNIYSSEEPEKNPLKRFWEGLVDFAAELLENQDEEQVAARIPFKGTLQNPKANGLEAFVSVLRNAFVGAFARSLEGSISLRDVRKNLKKARPDDEKPKRES